MNAPFGACTATSTGNFSPTSRLKTFAPFWRSDDWYHACLGNAERNHNSPSVLHSTDCVDDHRPNTILRCWRNRHQAQRSTRSRSPLPSSQFRSFVEETQPLTTAVAVTVSDLLHTTRRRFIPSTAHRGVIAATPAASARHSARPDRSATAPTVQTGRRSPRPRAHGATRHRDRPRARLCRLAVRIPGGAVPCPCARRRHLRHHLRHAGTDRHSTRAALTLQRNSVASVRGQAANRHPSASNLAAEPSSAQTTRVSFSTWKDATSARKRTTMAQ